MTTEAPLDAPRFFDVFVYGSLRQGLHNASMFGEDRAAGPFPARVHGYDLYSNFSDSFPYLARGTRTVQGEVVTVKWGRRLRSIISMEEGAGYDTVVGKVEVEQADGTWATQDAIMFVHREERKSARGALVEGGDWVEYLEELEARGARHHMFTEVRNARRPLPRPLDLVN